VIDPAEIERIATSIQDCGYCLIKEEELRRILQDGDSPSARFQLLATIALKRSWSFEFHPHDGEVRIAALPLIKINGNDGALSQQEPSSKSSRKKVLPRLWHLPNRRGSPTVTPQMAEVQIPARERSEKT
jgi:hypothetical protein